MANKNYNFSQVPVSREAGFNLKNSEITKAAFASEVDHPHEPNDYIYSRYRNPTIVATEKQIQKLEGAKWALLVESGMAAIDVAVSLFQKGKETKPWLFFYEIYGGTNSFIDTVLIKKRGLDIHRYYVNDDGTYDLVKLENMLKDIQPEFLYFEAVSNPMLIVADVLKVMELCKKYNVKTIVDNTFATPQLWKPLEDGASIVIHSATKYLSGHGNITAGVLCGNDDEYMKDAIEYRKWAGHFLSPDDAYRLGSQLKSFNLRFRQHCDNALALAKELEKHSNIEQVLYPGLESHPTYNEAIKLFGDKGYGGMMTFEIKGKDDADKAARRDKFIALLEDKVPLIPTLGDADSMLLPVEPVWGAKYPLPGVIRFSVGIENIEELKNDVIGALDQL